jgi:protein TonB
METKKNPTLDYRRKSGLFFNIGLVASLLAVITAFEWKVMDRKIDILPLLSAEADELLYVPPTNHVVPPPPKVAAIDIVEVVDDQEVPLDDFEIVFDQEKLADIPQVVFEMPEPEAEEPDVIWDIVESKPEFVGGLEAFYKFVGENLKYPAQARRLGIEGRVYVNFVVDRDGSLSQSVIARGIGAGCDEEVLRIIAMSPKWIPGKQRGNPVRVRMMMPITFRLQ